MPLVPRMREFGTTIFSEMTALAVRHDAVNLGQGFPDDDGPDLVREAAVDAMRRGHNQYAPGAGVETLRRAVAEHQRRFWGLDYDADREVTVTAGATEAVAAAVLALCRPGDEVLTLEPYYDSYAANIALAGADRRTVVLRAPEFALDPDALAAAVTPRTRLLILNSPHNPTGRVLDEQELDGVARVCVERDLIAVTDEVYEHLVYDGVHRPLASHDGMRERTITVSSAAKTFAFTGWKIGWACAPPPLTAALRAVKQFLTFSSGTPLQHAIAKALRLPDEYFDGVVADYRERRDLLVAGLRDLGLTLGSPQGTYFATVDVRPWGWDDGMAFCRWAPEAVGVAAVPAAAFHDDLEAGRPLVRFTFSKSAARIRAGLDRLADVRG